MKILVSENQFKLLVNLITEDDDRLKQNVMFVGDSLSAGKGTTWNYLLEKDYPEWNVTHVVKGGMKTDWMLNNMLPKLKEKKYDKVFIYGGTNNAFWVGTSLSNAVSDIQKMVDAVVKQGGQAYVFLGYDADSVMTDDVLKPTKKKDGSFLCDMDCMKKGRDRMVKLQNDLSSQIQGATIIPTVEGNSNWAAGDGIHPGSGPHKIMKDHVKKYIKNDKKIENQDTIDKIEDNYKKFFNDYFQFLSNKKQVDKNSDSNDIKRMQIILSLALKKPLNFNGEFDEKTVNLLKKYQEDNNLNTSGVFDFETQIDLTKKIFPSYSYKETQNLKKEVVNPSLIENPGVKVRKIPSDLEEKFKDIPGVDFNNFKSDVESNGIPIKYAMRQLYAESTFSPGVISCKTVSTAGARGIAQFMPKTWPQYGKGDPCKVQDALPAYVKLMSENLKRFPGRLDLAIAAYNSGPFGKNGKLYNDALNNNKPFTDLKGKIPAETYEYVSTILQP